MPTKYHSNNGFYPEDPDENDNVLWELLNVYADGEATPEEAARVEELLRSDPAYARQFEFVRMASDSAKSYVEIEPPAALCDTILAATVRKQTFATRLAFGWHSFRRSLAPRYAVPLAGAAAAVLVAVLLWPHNPTPKGGVASAPSQVAYDPSLPMEFNASTEPSELQSHGLMALALRAQRPGPEVRAVMPSQKSSPEMLVVTNPSPKKQNRQNTVKYASNNAKVSHDSPKNDDVQIASYVPMMDAQNQRYSPPPAKIPDSEIGNGEDVRLPELAKQTKPGPDPGPTGQQQPAPKVTIKTASLLPQVPPDPKQIFTKADLDRRRAALTDGYDRSTLRSIERKETTFSFIKGSF